jgi:secreted PhoX family phosphatase
VGAAGTAGNSDGTGGAARFSSPSQIAIDKGNNLFLADTGNHTIRKITPAGVVTTVAGLAGQSGSADGTGSNARFSSPIGIAVDQSGNLFIGDSDNDTIRKITPGGVVTTFAGLAGVAGSADGTGSAARFNGPRGLAIDPAGNLYVCDTFIIRSAKSLLVGTSPRWPALLDRSAVLTEREVRRDSTGPEGSP